MKARTIIFIFLTLVLKSTLFGQDCEVTDKVDEYPKRIFNASTIANKIKVDFNDQYCQAFAAYYWITTNIKYDLGKLENRKRSKTIHANNEIQLAKKIGRRNRKKIRMTLLKRKGVCQEYSELYSAILDELNIENEVVIGASKTKTYDIGNKKLSSTHAWNALTMADSIILVDCTWGAGYTQNERYVHEYTSVYFDMEPSRFYLKHFPKDTTFKTPYQIEDFLNFPLVYRGFYEQSIEFRNDKLGLIDSALDTLVITLRVQVQPEKISIKKDNMSRLEDFSYEYDKGELTIKVETKGFKNSLTLFLNKEAIIAYRKK